MQSTKALNKMIKKRGITTLFELQLSFLGLIIFRDIPNNCPPAYEPGRFCPPEELDEGCSNI